MAYQYTAWEPYTYAADIGAALYDQRHGNIPAGSFVQITTTQLACTSTIDTDADATALSISLTSAPTLGYAAMHAVDGDGVEFTDWLTVPAVTAPAWDSGNTFGTVGSGTSVTFNDPTWGVSGGVRTVTLTWTLEGTWVHGSFGFAGSYFSLTADALARADLSGGSTVVGGSPTYGGSSYVIGNIDPNDLTATFSIPDSEGWQFLIQNNNGIFGALEVDTWKTTFPAGSYDADLGTDPPALVTSGRGYKHIATPTNPVDATLTDGQSVLVGRTTTADSATSSRLDSAHVTVWQGVYELRGGTAPTTNFPPSDSLSTLVTDSALIAQYGPGATYEYQWSAQTVINARVDPVTGTSSKYDISGGDRVETRYLPSGATVTDWKTSAGLAADPDAYATVNNDGTFSRTGGGTEHPASTGVKIHVVDSFARDPAVHTTSTPTTTGGERGNKWWTTPMGYISVTGQRRIKYTPLATLDDSGKTGRVAFKPI